MNRRIFPITMPKWGIEMQQGTVTGWHVAVGASTQKGDHLLDVETEKIVNSVEAPVGGTLRMILAESGATENVGALIGVIADASVPEAELHDFVRRFTPADASFESAARQSPASSPEAPAAHSPAEAADGDTAGESDRAADRGTPRRGYNARSKARAAAGAFRKRMSRLTQRRIPAHAFDARARSGARPPQPRRRPRPSATS